MRGEEGHQVLGHRDRTHAGSTPAVGDAEGLVQVEMRDVTAELSRFRQAEECVQVRPVDVDLSAVLVDQREHLADALFVHPVCRRVRDHDGRQRLVVLLALVTEVLQIDRPVGQRADHHHADAGHDGQRLRSCRVRSTE